MIYSLSRVTVAFIWFYHGLFPKILFPSPTELELLTRGPIHISNPELLSHVIGSLEIAFAILVLVLWKKKWPMFLSGGSMLFLLIGAMIFWPALLAEAFNPLTLNLAVIVLSIINIKSLR